MILHPPRERAWQSWLLAGGWTLFIFFTLFLVRGIRDFVSDQWGRYTFAYVVFALIGIVAVWVLVFLTKQRKHYKARNFIWLSVITLVYAGGTVYLGKEAPEEALHFVEYGVLYALIFRALAHAYRDSGIFIIALLMTVTVGTIDEIVQWATPSRYYDLRDIGLNAFSGLLISLLIGRGLRPLYIKSGLSLKSMRGITVSGLVLLAIVAVVFSNTPRAIKTYTGRFPSLTRYSVHWGEMSTYGYPYRDPEIGKFQSRLEPGNLKQTDAARGANAAALVETYRGGPAYHRYNEFLQKYTALIDPYLHEVRVHLYARDRTLEKRVPYRAAYDTLVLGRAPPEDPPEKITKKNARRYRELTTVALMEHKILYTYFPTFMAHYRDQVGADWLADMDKEKLPAYSFHSKVSRELITRLSYPQMMGILAGLALLLIGLNVWYGRDHD